MITMKLDVALTDELLRDLRRELPADCEVSQAGEREFTVAHGDEVVSDAQIVSALNECLVTGDALCVDTQTGFDIASGRMTHRDIEVFNEDGTSYFI